MTSNTTPARLRALLVSVIVAAGIVTAVPAAFAASGRFVDDNGNIHEGYIEAIAAGGITRGCNPPLNDRYCPAANVSRGEMAAFLQRALHLPTPSKDYFGDDDGSVYESAINAIRAAGITNGCNPPADDEFCPDDPVTRGQLAAFMVRAFDLTSAGGNWFNDDDGSAFEGAIDKLRNAGITYGCNPPANDRFCPTDWVRRDAMATMLGRALGLNPVPVSSGETGEYDAAKLADVKNGISGMFVSRKNPGVHWFVVDHDSLQSSRYEFFAIDSVNDKLIWRGKFDKSGKNGAISGWSDVEDLTGVRRDGNWYLAIWDNGKDSIYEFKEPDLRLGQSLQSKSGLIPSRIVRPEGGVVGSGNVEGMAWSQAEDAMYWVGPRGTGSDLNDNKRDIMRVTNWTSYAGGSKPTAKFVGNVINRPKGQNIPNAAGALDISTDGNTMVIQGVATNGSKENTWVMLHRKAPGQSWASRLAEHPQVTTGESIKARSPGENVALNPSATQVYSAGEGNKGSEWAWVFSYPLG